MRRWAGIYASPVSRLSSIAMFPGIFYSDRALLGGFGLGDLWKKYQEDPQLIKMYVRGERVRVWSPFVRAAEKVPIRS